MGRSVQLLFLYLSNISDYSLCSFLGAGWVYYHIVQWNDKVTTSSEMRTLLFDANMSYGHVGIFMWIKDISRQIQRWLYVILKSTSVDVQKLECNVMNIWRILVPVCNPQAQHGWGLHALCMKLNRTARGSSVHAVLVQFCTIIS